MSQFEETAAMFDCCYRVVKDKESSENVSARRTFLMRGTGCKPSIGQLTAARVEHPAGQEESEESKFQRPYVIRAMRPEELEEAYQIRLQTNYVFSKNTIHTSWKLQPDSFLVAVSDDDEVLGSASWCRFASNLLLVEQVTVDRDYHGMGIGPDLMAAVVDVVTENLMLRIPEHDEQAFVREMPSFPYRHSTLLLGTWPAPVSPQRLPADAAGVTVMPFKREHMASILRYDQDVFHCQRQPLVERIVQGEKSVSALAFNEEMELLGYGAIQEMNNDTGDVSLLLADDEVIAGNLLKALAQHSSTPKLLTLTSPAPPDKRSTCFATRMGFSVRQAYLCLFTRWELSLDYPRIFSFGAV